MFNRNISIDKGLIIGNEEYKLESGDYLSVHVQGLEPETYEYLNPNFRNPSLAGASDYEKSIEVNKRGEINLPFINNLIVDGLTIQELTDTLESKYASYIKDPTVTIKLLNFNISIIGEVKKPGIIKAEGESLTLFDALAKAGGPTINGNRFKTILIREENGKNIKYDLNLTSKELAFPNVIYLKKGDVIYVPETRRSYLNSELRFLNIAISGITSVLTIFVLLQRVQ